MESSGHDLSGIRGHHRIDEVGVDLLDRRGKRTGGVGEKVRDCNVGSRFEGGSSSNGWTRHQATRRRGQSRRTGANSPTRQMTGKLAEGAYLSPNTTISVRFDLNELGAVEKAKYDPEGVELKRFVEAEPEEGVEREEGMTFRNQIGRAEAVRGLDKRRKPGREESILREEGGSTLERRQSPGSFWARTPTPSRACRWLSE
jgi:hypothetical protein